MIICIRLKNFYSLFDEIAIDFTADTSTSSSRRHLPGNLIDYNGDKFVKIIGLFGANASGKSNIIKAIDFCRNLILESHNYNENTKFRFEPFKFKTDVPSEFYINFVVEGIEYEYSFSLLNDMILAEHLYYFPHKRRARVFSRENTYDYTFGKGLISRPTSIISNTGPKTLFLSRASVLNRQLPAKIFRFFAENMVIGYGEYNIRYINKKDLEENKEDILKAFKVADSDITDIQMVETSPDIYQIFTYHKGNMHIPFNFQSEESEGTKKLLYIILLILKSKNRDVTFILDEFDLKLHQLLSEFLLDTITKSSTLQLLFSSHNPALINYDRRRLDQIVIVSKDNEGITQASALSDYSGLSLKTDLRKAYLQGRFDGIPYLGETLIQ
ncbi:MAG: AAA family ATPase [Muribaculaceae bacterium]|nr:AAA family ATPase [Muribaculaceae bacterium]